MTRLPLFSLPSAFAHNPLYLACPPLYLLYQTNAGVISQNIISILTLPFAQTGTNLSRSSGKQTFHQVTENDVIM